VSRGHGASVVISGLGLVTREGEGAARLERLDEPSPPPVMEEVEPGLIVPVGRLGRLHRHPFRERFERMNQLDALSQFAFIATGHALDDADITTEGERFVDTGVIIGTCFGCQEANYRFDQFLLDSETGPEGVRPAFFKSTVDNVPAGWISLGYGFKGINATLVSGRGAGAEALLTAIWALRSGRARRVIAGGIERLLALQIAAQHRREQGAPLPYVAEGGALHLLELAEEAAGRDHQPRASILEADRFILGERALPLDGVSVVSVVSESGAAREASLAALEAAGWQGEVLVESEETGDAFAAQAPLALALLIEQLARRTAGRPLGRGSRRQKPACGLLLAEGEEEERFLFLVEA
jgi:hypothetical protein